MDATLKVSATFTYADNTTEQILSYLDENGQISVNDSTNHDQTADDMEDQTSALDNLQFSYNGSTYDFAASITGASGKTASSVVLELSGRVALDDDTWGDFYYLFNSVEDSSDQLSNYGDAYFGQAMEDAVLNARFVAAVSTAGFILSTS